jgi:hypothetical protein
MLAVLIAVAATLAAAKPALAENAMYSCTDANGAVSLTNVPTNGQCEKLFSYAAPAPEAASAPAAPVAAVAPAAATVATIGRRSAGPDAAAEQPEAAARPALNASPLVAMQPRTPTQVRMAQRREEAIQQTRDAYASGQGDAGVNRAVNRRYLMTNRAEYMQVNGVTPQ